MTSEIFVSKKQAEVIEELLAERSRKLQKKSDLKPNFPLHEICFQEQLHFIKDPAKRKTACNSRRSGKTYACASDMIDTCLENPGVNVLYITLSRLNAKRIIWKDLCDLCHKYNLGADINISELTIKFKNGSTIYLSGAKDEAEIEKFRGLALKKVYIDEAQAFKSYLQSLIDDILSPSLIDFDGSLILIGTPSAAKAGVFYEACHQGKGFRNYVHHHWTIFDNPHIERKSGKPVATLIQEELDRKGITKDDPSVRREIFGEWAEDSNSLVYKFTFEKNIYQSLPPKPRYFYTMGIDLGFDDSDAITIWAYSLDDPNLYMVEEWQRAKLTVSELAVAIKNLESKYPHCRKVIDTGGLGKKVTEELRLRHQIALEPADKTQKHAFIELMNDDFRKGVIKVLPSMGIIEDWRLLQWDRDTVPPKEDDRFDNHRPDAALYSWREARHFNFREKAKTPSVDSEAHIMQYWDRKGKEIAQRNQNKWWEK